jgi:hypothetical protein
VTLRTFSHGGGVQSTAALVLSAQGRIDYPTHLFANVGDDSEAPETLRYVHEVSMPYAAEHGIELHELHRIKRDGTRETLLGRLTKPGSRSLPIPIRMSNGAPGTRSCTIDFKLKVLARWHREHGATDDDPATVGIGFTVDEIERVGNARARRGEVVTYPLLDLELNRGDCLALIARAGLPQPPRSACWFCPMHRPSVWAEMRRDDPARFADAVALEALLNERRDTLGRDHVYLTRFAKPLDEAVAEAQQTLFDADGWGSTCDEGVCFT